MIKKTISYGSYISVKNITSLGYLYDDMERKIMVPTSVSPVLKDKFGKTVELEDSNLNPEVLLLELNMYSGFEYTVNLKINKSSVLLGFSLEESTLPAFGITYKFYHIGGYNNYALAISYDSSVVSIELESSVIKKTGNCLGNVKGQLIGYSKVIDHSLNSYRTLTTKTPSSIDSLDKPRDPVLELNSLSSVVYKVR